MTTPQKQRRQDDNRQPAQTPLADAIVLGTAAGGLVLGTMQAQAATAEASDVHTPVPGLDVGDHPATTGPAAELDSAQQADQEPALAPTGMDDPAQLAVMPVEAALPSPMVTSVEDQLVHELSQQMAGTISKVMEGAEPGMSAEAFSQAISSDIVQSAQEIVARLDIGSLLTSSDNLGETTLAEIDPVSMVDGILGATANLADTILTDVGALPSEILGGTIGDLADLPSALLGNEGPDGSDGLLSDLFYADGGSDSLAIPDLSDAASSLVADVGSSVGGLLGLSYTDVPDLAGSHGLNALSLL
ncbi:MULTISPECIES: hypothetical protein [unclassified Devosia]|uniref:hypothetical protein n=1 Tax=unclassified Devosia TaxID=196773 RepID=UPI000712DD16|nr:MULTISPECIES: hypothetical protein [unclassified Devosia]KQN76819.1 hypothetical protein ASE94_17955 [Devosia sp. Leaf64]KQT49397.1 hypothetical protein ASG47_03420 [Devosia sp. Leaf420]